jgi:hypothetical protein
LLEGGIALETFSGLRVHKLFDAKGRWARGFTGKAVYAMPGDTFNRKFAELTLRLLEAASLAARRSPGSTSLPNLMLAMLDLSDDGRS